MTSFAPVSQGQPTSQQVHQVAPPPQNSTLVRNIAIILASGAALYLIAEGIETLLLPYGITASAIENALGLSDSGSAPTPRTRLKRHGLTPTSDFADIPRAAAKEDLYFRAAYVLNASRRLQEASDEGKDLRDALAAEAKFWQAHEDARRGRLDAAGEVARAAGEHGPLLGWYLDPTLNNEAECIAADGNNFYADEGTIIGYPGAVHPNCGCVAGEPHVGAGMVNDAVAPLVVHVPAAKIFKLKRAG